MTIWGWLTFKLNRRRIRLKKYFIENALWTQGRTEKKHCGRMKEHTGNNDIINFKWLLSKFGKQSRCDPFKILLDCRTTNSILYEILFKVWALTVKRREKLTGNLFFLTVSFWFNILRITLQNKHNAWLFHGKFLFIFKPS